MNEPLILRQIDKGVLTITLNRPDRLNSFNDEMHHQLAAAITLAEKEPSLRSVLLTGAGRGFCAGQDLNARNVSADQAAPDLGLSVERYYNPLIRRLRALPKPVICAVNGVAAGAGASLALACDIVIAADNASFIHSFCKLGLIPDCGGSWYLPRLAGHARAMGMALLGEKVNAQQALEWGMIWQVIAAAELADYSTNMAIQLAQQPTYGLGLIKKALYSSATNTLDQQLDLERDLQRLGGRSADYREGVSAFLAKRPAHFSGK